MQVENVSHWLTDKQLMSNHVSLFEDMRFSIGTPITQLGLAWEPGNDKQTMYFVFVIKTRHKSVSRGNSKFTRKEISKLISCDYLTIRQNVAR